MMETGVRISVIYTDEYVTELRVMASNGVFAGQVDDVYAELESLREFAGVLRGVPANFDDTRSFELGSFDAAHVGGGARFRFYCLDSVGHATAEVSLRSDSRAKLSVRGAVVLHIPVEAATVDLFTVQLERIATLGGQAALL